MKHFKLKLTFLYLSILSVLLLLSVFIGKREYFFTQLIITGCLLFLIWKSYQLIDTTNRLVAKFLFAHRYKDFSITFPYHYKNSFQQLQSGLNHSLRSLAEQKKFIDRENQMVQFLIKQLPIGILIINEDGYFEVLNESACDLLEIPSIKKFNQDNKFQNDISNQLRSIEVGNRHKIKFNSGKELQVQKLEFKDNTTKSIFFIHPIEDVNKEVEMQAWINLTKVLSHEIANSVGSIVSISNTIQENVKKRNFSNDIDIAADRIVNRCKSLLSFAESYQEINHVKKANRTWNKLSSIVDSKYTFLSRELNDIQFELTQENEELIYIDKEQIEQVLINLFLNAKQALLHTLNPKIKIHIWKNRQNVFLQFINNGKDIPPKDQNQIFIPFYSTKKDGKGIGLSLSRQLMINNNGSISLRKSNSNETVFELKFQIQP